MSYFPSPRRAIAASAVVLAGASSMYPVYAGAQEDPEVLFAELEDFSRDTSALGEEIKGLEDEIAASEQELLNLEAVAATAAEKAQVAKDAHREYQKYVDGIALARNRGAFVDPMTNALSSTNPQNLIDRSSYLDAVTRSTKQKREELAQKLRAAADEANTANGAVAVSQHQRNNLMVQHSLLERERTELSQRVADLEARIDALDPAARAAWANKNAPSLPFMDSSQASGVVASALSQLGAPYGWGAAGPTAFDCSGLMYWSYQQNGKTIPRTSQAQIAGGTPVSRAELQPGDLVGYYPGVTHVAMYIGNGQVVHASDYGIPVQVVSVDSMPWAGAARY